MINSSIIYVMPRGIDKYGIHIGTDKAGDVDCAPTIINWTHPFKTIDKKTIVINELTVIIIF